MTPNNNWIEEFWQKFSNLRLGVRLDIEGRKFPELIEQLDKEARYKFLLEVEAFITQEKEKSYNEGIQRAVEEVEEYFKGLIVIPMPEETGRGLSSRLKALIK